MRFVIDGYNLLHYAGLAERARSWNANRERFLGWLGDSVPPHVEYKVVFDAQKMSRLKTVAIESDRVVIAKGMSADDWIDAFVRKQPPGMWTVISSDRQVRESAKQAHAGSWTCDAFLDWLSDPRAGIRKEAPPLPEAEKPEAMTALELRQLEQAFAMDARRKR